MGVLPRQESPLERDGSPLVEFAADLRRLREDAGKPSYRELARRAHYSSTALSDAAAGKRLPSLAVALAFVRACGGDETSWERRWRETSVATLPAEPGEGAPYQGLAAYGVGDADRFFGREQLVDDLVDRLSRHRFLAVFGPSGSGKSSVLRAGLVPRLAGPVVLLTPGPHPLEEIAVHLANQAGTSAFALREDLTEAPESLALVVRQIALGAELVLVVDQFEEIFTLCHEQAERDAFITALIAAASVCRVVIGVRADFYARCSGHAGLVRAMRDVMVTVGPMTPDELRRAITQSAQTTGCKVESALVTTLVSETSGQAGTLPLLSHALLSTWHRRQGNVLTTAAFERSGGLHGALAQTAEAEFAAFDDEQRAITKALFLRLSALGDGTEDTKRRVAMTEIDSDPAVDAVLTRLTATRLLTHTRDGVEITHEALIRSWPRLRDWLADDRDGQRLHRELTEATAAWERHGRDPGSLLRGARLDAIADWVWESEPGLNEAERQYLRDSVTADERDYTGKRRASLRNRALVLLQGAIAVVVLLLVVMALATPVYRQGELEKSRWATNEAMRLIDTNPELAAHVALAAYKLDRSPEARHALTAATAEATRTRHQPDGERVSSLSLSATSPQDPDGVGWQAGAMISNPFGDTSRAPNGRVLGGGAHASLSPAQTLAATIDRDGVTRLWHLPADESFTLPGRHTAARFGSDNWLFTEDGRSTTAWYVKDPRAPRNAGTLPGTTAGFGSHDIALTVEGENIHVWRLHPSADPLLLRTYAHPGGAPLAVAYSAGSERVLAGGPNGRLTLWNLNGSTRPVASIAAHDAAITAIAVNDADGQLATAGADGRIAVWTVLPEPRKTAEYNSRAEITTMMFSNGLLATTDKDNSVLEWQFAPGAAAAAVCGRVTGARITGDAWRSYFSAEGGLESPCSSRFATDSAFWP